MRNYTDAFKYVYILLVYMFDVELKEWGNSYGIRISKTQAKQLGLKKGDTINVDLVKKDFSADGFGIFKGAGPFERNPYDDTREY